MVPSRHGSRSVQAEPRVRKAPFEVGPYRCVQAVALLFATVMSNSDKKRVLDPLRVRRPPREGWSWIDRRFLRDHAPRLDHDAILLYLFLAAVADRHGVSFYGELSVAALLRIDPTRVVAARAALVGHDLVAYRAPTVQVLSLPVAPARASGSGAPMSVGELLQRLARGQS